jgi:hypothetical protein
MSNWISVKDNLPKPLEMVLVKGGIGYIDYAGAWRSLTAGCNGDLIRWEVTHWMPFPSLPESPRCGC